MQKIFKFIQGVDFDSVENLPNIRTRFQIVFDDFCQF